MKLEQLRLRCYGEQEHDGGWFTICLELNLYARGDTFDEARDKLNAMIADYLREAVTEDAAYLADLIPRRAPAYFWLRYWRVRLLVALHRLSSARPFFLPLPMVPAVR